MNSMDLIIPFIAIGFASQNPNVIVTVFCALLFLYRCATHGYT